MSAYAEADDRYQIRHDFRYLHEPITEDASATWVVGRSERAQELADRIMLSRGGAFLVSGLRGVGKTTCVRYAINIIRQGRDRFRRLGEDTELVDVWINLGRPLEPVQLLHHLIRHLYLRLKEMQLLPRLDASLREDLQTAFMRTSFEISSRSLAGDEVTDTAELSIGAARWLGLDFASKLSSARKRSQSEEEALKYLPYDEKAAEFEILSLSRRLTNGVQNRDTAWQRWWRRVLRKRPSILRAKVVFVLDELDKLDARKISASGSRLDPVLQALKSVFTGSGFSFIFIGGKEMEEHLLQDVSLGDSIYESIFAFDLYLPCLWEQQTDIVMRCFEPVERDRVKKSATLGLYLRYKGRGVPRRIWRELNKYVLWNDHGPVLTLDVDLRRYMEVFAKVEEALDEEEIFKRVRGIADFALIDRRRLCFYYIADWILSRGKATFTVTQVQQQSKLLNLGDANGDEPAAQVAERVLNLLLERAFIEGAGRERTVIDAGATLKSYRLAPWVLRAFEGASDKQFAPEASPEPPPDRVVPLERIGRYRVLEKIGEGGFAIIYRVADGPERIMAAKILRADLAATARGTVDLFKREIAVLRKLNHPGIVRVYDSGEENGLPYLVMELLDGCSLRRVLDTVKSVEPAYACSIAIQLANIFQYVHSCGLARLDIKPSNVVLTTMNQIKTVDFGITVSLDDAGERSAAESATMGTPGYISPEQKSRGHADVRGDVFSLGVILYEMLTGQMPPEWRHGDGSPVLWQMTGIPSQLKQTVRRSLDEDPDQRFQTMAEFAAALTPFAKAPPANVIRELRIKAEVGVASKNEYTKPGIALRPTDEREARETRHAAAPVSTAYQPPHSRASVAAPPMPAEKAEHASGGRVELTFDLAHRVCRWDGLGGHALKLDLGGSLKLGRDASSVDLPLDDPWISRQHVAFFPLTNGVEVEDLSTANGTLLNGKPIRREKLADGDCLEVGDHKILVHIMPVGRTIVTAP